MKHVTVPGLVFPLLVGPVQCAPASLVLIAAMASFWLSYGLTAICLGHGVSQQPLAKGSAAVISAINPAQSPVSLR
jgi:hypothetical protein